MKQPTYNSTNGRRPFRGGRGYYNKGYRKYRENEEKGKEGEVIKFRSKEIKFEATKPYSPDKFEKGKRKREGEQSSTGSSILIRFRLR